MRVRDIEIFYWVAKLSGFHAAARRLNTTQPNVSARIQALETRIGAPLFIRNRKRTELSPEGRLLMPYAEKMISLSEEILLRVGDPSARHAVLRLGAAESVAHTWLVALLDAIRREYAGAVIELTIDTSPHLHHGLENGDLDLALVMAPSAPVPGVVIHHLYKLQLAWFASTSLGYNTSIGKEDLKRATVIAYPSGTALHDSLSGLVETFGIAPERIVSSNSVATMVRLAVDGLGLAPLPPAMVKREVESGYLGEVEVDWPLPTLDIAALRVATSDNPLPSAVSLLAAEVCHEVLSYPQNGELLPT